MSRRWGFAVVIAAIVGIGIGVLITVLAGVGSGARLVIGEGIGLIIGGGLLTIFDRQVVRRLDGSRPAGPAGATVSATVPDPAIPAIPAFDPETGEPLRRARSSFFGLSLEVWTLILVGCGVLLVGVGVVVYLAS